MRRPVVNISDPMSLPVWIRLPILISTLMQINFGITLLVAPARMADLWPWVMPPLTARVLGAITLVSVPMAILAIALNRYVFAAIPCVMMGTYRVLQLAAGIIHIDRFGANMTSVNYFGGETIMLAVYAYTIYAGQRGILSIPNKQKRDDPMPWHFPQLGRSIFMIIGCLYVVLGIVFFVPATKVAPFWFDVRGMTPLTARLFSSALLGLGLGTCLVSYARDWRAVCVPATGMVTLGIAMPAGFLLGYPDFGPATPVAWLVVATPVIMLVVGVSIIISRPTQVTIQRTTGLSANNNI